jgi:predicted nucleotidyltransferase
MTDGTTPARDKLIRVKFRAALNEMYGERLECAVLFGSQAGGDARPDSDYDVAVFLKDLDGSSDRWAELERLAVFARQVFRRDGGFRRCQTSSRDSVSGSIATPARNPAGRNYPVTAETDTLQFLNCERPMLQV